MKEFNVLGIELHTIVT